jgi:UDP-N-acetylmuramoylalanine--D-glutamate ligase
MRTLVLGAGVSGKAAADLAQRLGHEVIGYDEDEAAAESARRAGYAFGAGPWEKSWLYGVDLVVTSPGIPDQSMMIADATESKAPLWSELEFASQQATAPLLAVTGTNGKTSTVIAATAMLEASGVKTCAAGNIGTALSDVAQDAWDVIVVEASSFQLRFIDRFRPVGAAVLNVTPDHLDWHGSFDAYLAAKRRITANQDAGDVLAYGADDAGARAATSGTKARTVPVSGRRIPGGGAGVEDGLIRIDSYEFSAPEIGPDFLEDLVAAAVLARVAGATESGIREGLAGFRPGPHRRATVGIWDGVRWVDDSKATNPHAAVAAAAAYPSVVLIAGGRNKGLDLSPMADMPSVRHVITFGESAFELGELLESDRVSSAHTLEEAIAAADEIAGDGDTVLLAPGCASFDMFTSYAHRGDAFQQIVRSRKEGADGQ